MITETELFDKFEQIDSLMKLSSFWNWVYDNRWNFKSEDLDIIEIACQGKKEQLINKNNCYETK